MVYEARQAFEAWRQAEAAARLAEAELAAAWQKYSARTGPAPGEDLMAEVSRRRSAANERLLQAMARMAEAHPRSGSANSTWPPTSTSSQPPGSSSPEHPDARA